MLLWQVQKQLLYEYNSWEIVWKYVYVEWTNAKLSQCLR